jgi:hypothetical protein
MAALKLFFLYVICGRGELPSPQRKPKQRQVLTWKDSLRELKTINLGDNYAQ